MQHRQLRGPDPPPHFQTANRARRRLAAVYLTCHDVLLRVALTKAGFIPHGTAAGRGLGGGWPGAAATALALVASSFGALR